MTTTHPLETAEAAIAYDVHGPLPTADGRPPLFMIAPPPPPRPPPAPPPPPPLFMIAQPMTASGFATLVSLFPDRTVITYDPRGLGRSTRSDNRVDNSPTVQASDVHAVIEALGAGPVDMFASRGRGDRACAGRRLSRRRDQAGGTRAAADPGASRRRGGRARPRRLSRCIRGKRGGCRHG